LSSKLWNIAGSITALYFFVSAIMLVKESAKAMGGFLTSYVVSVIRDTTSGAFAGWIGTALVHSSGAFDSIVVTFTSTGIMPLSLGVATIIGAELGTTVTPFLISILNQFRGRRGQSAAFNVTVSHVLYNLSTFTLFFLLEIIFGVFTKIALLGSTIFVKAPWLAAVPDLLDVITPWVPMVIAYLPPWICLIIGGVMLIGALTGVEKYMTDIFSMPRSWNLIRATFTKPVRAFFAGLIFTMLVPSTTVMVSLLVPLASSGVISAEYYILPYILGANIGTVFDVMIAAMATGDPVAMGVWLVHLSINVIGAAIFMLILKPFSKIVRNVSERMSASPKLSLSIVIIFHLIPTSIILYYVFTR
jgi:sodium-dependent phosphate cotransporter